MQVADPQQHSHCAILNRVRGVDGQWRTLDGAAIYRHAHAAGAIYGATIERELTKRLAVSWTEPGARVHGDHTPAQLSDDQPRQHPGATHAAFP